MCKRSLYTITLLLVLLPSACGNVLAAALCPHMAQHRAHACSEALAVHHAASQEMSEGMQMAEMRETEPVPESATQGNVLSRPSGECEHCIGHSRASLLLAALREVDQSARAADDGAAPSRTAGRELRPASCIHIFSASEHAPPGASASARHVLINLFRI